MGYSREETDTTKLLSTSSLQGLLARPNPQWVQSVQHTDIFVTCKCLLVCGGSSDGLGFVTIETR